MAEAAAAARPRQLNGPRPLEMLDFRYHALSLAAVLLALTVGVLLGVAIGDSDLVSSAKNGIVRDLRSEVTGAQAQAADLKETLALEENLSGDLYPLAVNGLLVHRNIGLVFLGRSSEAIDQLAREAVTEAGGNVSTVIAVREPLDLAGLAAQAAGTRYTALARDQLIRAFGLRVGSQLVSGGKLLDRVQTPLLSSFDGVFGSLDGVVIERDHPGALSGVQVRQVDEFEGGLIAGVQASRVTAVGVELTSTLPSQVPWYQSRDMASVDDLDTLAGRTALALSLAGAHGAWGVKSSADALLPRAAPPKGSAAEQLHVRSRR